METGKIISITEYKNTQNSLKVLEQIMEKFRKGEATGLIFALRLGDFDHGVGVTGAYKDDPFAARTAAAGLFDIFSKAAKSSVKSGKL